MTLAHERAAAADPMDLVVAQATRDALYREKLLGSPREALRDFGIELPAGVKVAVIEETSDSLAIVLPFVASAVRNDGEEDFEQMISMTASRTHVSCCACSSTSTRAV